MRLFCTSSVRGFHESTNGLEFYYKLLPASRGVRFLNRFESLNVFHQLAAVDHLKSGWTTVFSPNHYSLNKYLSHLLSFQGILYI